MMNKIYKVIWSKVRNCYVCVSEVAKNHTKDSRRRGAVGGAEGTACLCLKGSTLTKGVGCSLLAGAVVLGSPISAGAADIIPVNNNSSSTASSHTVVVTAEGWTATQKRLVNYQTMEFGTVEAGSGSGATWETAYGGYIAGSSVYASNNTIIIAGGATNAGTAPVIGSVYGAHSINGSKQHGTNNGNTVEIYNGVITNVYGGRHDDKDSDNKGVYTSKSGVTNNKVNIHGGTITGEIVGGVGSLYGNRSSGDNNYVDIKNNEITIDRTSDTASGYTAGTLNLQGADLYGYKWEKLTQYDTGFPKAANNTLTVNTYNVDVNSLNNFDTITFTTYDASNADNYIVKVLNQNGKTTDLSNTVADFSKLAITGNQNTDSVYTLVENVTNPKEILFNSTTGSTALLGGAVSMTSASGITFVKNSENDYGNLVLDLAGTASGFTYNEIAWDADKPMLDFQTYTDKFGEILAVNTDNAAITYGDGSLMNLPIKANDNMTLLQDSGNTLQNKTMTLNGSSETAAAGRFTVGNILEGTGTTRRTGQNVVTYTVDSLSMLPQQDKSSGKYEVVLADTGFTVKSPASMNQSEQVLASGSNNVWETAAAIVSVGGTSGNHITVDGASVTGAVYGAYDVRNKGGIDTSQFNFARDNTVDIVSGSVHDVYGAYLGGDFTYESPFSDFYGARAYANTVNLSGGTVTGTVYGAANMYAGVSGGANASNNVININGAADLTAATLIGAVAYKEDTPITGNTLNVNFDNVKVDTVKTFDTVNINNNGVVIGTLQDIGELKVQSGGLTLGSMNNVKKVTLSGAFALTRPWPPVSSSLPLPMYAGSSFSWAWPNCFCHICYNNPGSQKAFLIS